MRIVLIAFVSVAGMMMNHTIQSKAHTLHFLKEDLEVAVHDASLDVVETELTNGRIVFDQAKALITFRESFEKNSRLTAADYRIVDLVFLDHATINSYPTTYISNQTDFNDIFNAPTIIAFVEVNKDAYFQNGDTEKFIQVASYSYKINESQVDFPFETIGNPNEQGFVWVSPYTRNITSTFGYRIHPISNEEKLHAGTDIASAGVENTPAVSAKDGTVIYTGLLGSYGNLVVIDHGNGIETRYAHLSSISVTTGTNVVAGQVVGRVGSTGGSTAAHLHFEIRINGVPYDPMTFYP